MRSSLWPDALGVLLAACVAMAAQDDREQKVLPLNGAFFQFNNDNLDADWSESVCSVADMDMRVIIIQYLKLDDTEYIRDKKDPTQEILDFCDRLNRDVAPSEKKMRVFIGLADLSNWSGGRGKDFAETQNRLEKAKAECSAMARRAKELYGKYASFSGWYIPLEADNCYDPDDAETLRAVHEFYYDIADECQRQLYRPVAVSAFFNTENGGRDPAQTARAYTKILTGTGLKYLLVQDGIGERKWDDQIQAKVGPYFEAFATACSDSKMELWGVAECFCFPKKDANGVEQRIPLENTDRLKTQLQVMQAAGAKATVAFEFYRYMDPGPQGQPYAPARKLRRDLYFGYLRDMLHKYHFRK
jgi:hypothetical protein